MSDRASVILLWLFVINLGVAFGAGIYEHRIVISRWLSTSPEGGARWSAEAAIRDDTGRRFWGMVTTLPLTLLTLANLYAAWRSTGIARGWWLSASLATLADRAFTFAYFIPTMVRLMATSDSPAAVASATRWRNLNHLRSTILLGAWLAALKAFALFHQQQP